MIEFTHGTTRYKVKPENAQAIRALAAKPPKIKNKVDRKHDATRRDYPEFYVGMETSEYLSRYASLNNRLLLTLWTHIYADRPAPMLDASQPEMWEEVDEHYIPTTEDIKFAKKLTTRAALVALIEACEEGDPEQIAAAVIRARGTL
jgi:hypothetical protein